jgi:hypothetical protein
VADEVAFLSHDWPAALVGAYAHLPQDDGASALVQHTVTDAPDGEVSYWTNFEDGRLTDAGPGPRLDATVIITTPYALAAQVATGQVELPVTFMQGRAKVGGDHAALLRVLAVAATPAYRVAMGRLAERTRAPGL